MSTPRYNGYQCEHGCQTFTVDVHEGVTPFYIRCEFKGREDRPANPAFMKDGKCIGIARSMFYPKGPLPSWAIVSHEWYAPNLMDPQVAGKLSEGEIEHVKRGGLLLRERTDRAPVLHKEEA